MSKRKNIYKSATMITNDEYKEITHCSCGTSIFKYHDSSKNMFIAKCKNVKELYDTKTKSWINSKKQPCGFICIFKDETPVFKKEIVIKKIKEIPQNPHKILRYNLDNLFRYYYLDQSRTTTLQEIDYLVKFSLWRPQKQLDETMEQYQKRIYSEKIIDRNTKIINLSNINVDSEYIFTEDPDDPEEPDEPEDPEEQEDDDESILEESENESIADKEEEDDSENVDLIDIPDYDDDEGGDYDYDD